MKLSQELVAEMANMSKRMKVFDDVTEWSVCSINNRGVQLSFDAFIKTFDMYVTELNVGSIYPIKYKAVAGGVLFYALTTEAELIKHNEVGKHNE